LYLKLCNTILNTYISYTYDSEVVQILNNVLNGLFCSEPASASEKKVMDDACVCQICFMEERAVLFLPCGHLIACVKCAPSLSTCAVCRQLFTATVRAFLS
jgi:hypothetical protein